MRAHIITLLCIIFYLSGNGGSIFVGIPSEYFLYLTVGYSLFIIAIYKHEMTKIEWLSLLIVGSMFSWLCIKYLLGTRGEYRVPVLTLILPALLVSVLPHKQGIESIKAKNYISRFLCFFFIVECSIAILEFVLHKHIFGWIDMTYAKGVVKYATQSEFRSVSLLGSPLNNALVVTILMLFYLFNPRLILRQKAFLWILGLTAVFCFNARFAITINLLSLAVFAVKETLYKDNVNKKQIAILFIVTLITLYMLYNYGWGGRLWNMQHDDSSIEARLKLFKYISNLQWSDYLWGYSAAEIRHEMSTKIGVKIIENFWVVYVFHFGIIITALEGIYYYVLCKRLFNLYPQFDKIVISVLFLLLASTNISLYSNFTPLFMFLLCCYTYQPMNIIDRVELVNKIKKQYQV